MKIIKNKSLIYLGLLCVLSVATILPFFHAGFFTMHDDTQVARVSEMATSLGDGMIPVRWVMNLGYGYGYPIFTFYAPFAYYFGAFWMGMGANALLATKIMMALGTVLAGLFMYLFAKDIWDEEGGYMSALFYVFAPYHAVNIYIRGAVAELWGMAFLPLVFYGVWNTYKTGNWRYVVLGGIAYAGVILSHNLTAMMVTPFILVFMGGMIVRYLIKKDYRRIFPLFILLFLGVGLSAFYWLPAISEMQYTNVISQVSGTGSKFGDHFVCLSQLWNSPWGYAGSGPGCIDGVSFRIGKLHLLAVLLAFFLGGFVYKKSKEKGILVFGSIGSFFVTVFLTLQNSEFLWQIFSPMSYLQFPWRFLLLIIFFSSFLAGGLVWYSKQILSKKQRWIYPLLIAVVLGILVLYSKLFVPLRFISVTAQTLTNEQTIRFTTSKISDEYMPQNFIKPKTENDVVKEKAVILSGKATINILRPMSHAQGYSVSAKDSTTILLKTAPFPAWKTFLDGKEIPHKNTNRGMEVTLPSETHMLVLQYFSTQIEMISNLITLTSMVVLLVGIIYLHQKKML